MPKSGTTSLYHYLKEHPDIFLPIQKELHYFSCGELVKNISGPGDKNALAKVIRNKEAYENMFSGVNSETRYGDISPSYFYFSKTTIPLIKQYLGEEVKIIISLRDPIERAYSNFMHQRRLFLETKTFDQALEEENIRMKNNYGDFWRYKQHSLYYENCKNFINAFGQENVFIFLFEDLKATPYTTLNNICKFLDVNSSFQFQNISKAHNKGGIYKTTLLTKLLLKPSKLKQFTRRFFGQNLINIYKDYKIAILENHKKPKPKINTYTADKLQNYFNDDVINLQKLNIDTSKWSYFHRQLNE